MSLSTNDTVWIPSAMDLDKSRLLSFCRESGCATPAELDARSREDPVWFWRLAVRWLDLDWQVPPDQILSGLAAPAETKWFPGAKINLADNAVDRWVRRGRGDDVALVHEDEAGECGRMTFRELAREVDRVARGLMALDIGMGDRVGIQLPMVAESVVAQLACAKVGAIAVPIFSGFGVGGVVGRLRHAGARAFILADGFSRRGRNVDLRAISTEAKARLPDLRTVIVVELSAASPSPALGPEIRWSELGGEHNETPLPAATVDAGHPLLIAYTSGTTSAPKGAVLTHAGFTVKTATDAAWCFDLGSGDVATWITDPGWIMAPIISLGGLLVGSAIATYSGAPDFPTPDRLWNVVRRNAITMLGVSPTLVRSLMAAGHRAMPPDLAALRVIASSGEPWTTDAYMWLFSEVTKRRLPIINYSGGTEVSGAILSNTTAQPIHPGGFAGPVPGMGADVADDRGESLRGRVGELVLRVPSPGMTDGFWNDRKRYHDTYWSRWPNTWLHGDSTEVDKDGVWYIRGRSDDTLNVAGKRIAPAEVEDAVNAHPSIADSAAIGVPDTLKGEVFVVFARRYSNDDDTRDDDQVRQEIDALVTERLGRALRPRSVLLVDDLPRTQSGKLLRRVIRAAYLGEPVGDVSSLSDPGAVESLGKAR